MNKWSNDFGRSWIRGVIFSFGTGLLFYNVLLFSSTEFPREVSPLDTRLIASFLKFMNPLRFYETEFLFRPCNNNSYLTLSPISYFIDFVSRIIIAYGFYQTIQAFRRFGRKP
ncbi:hypothetical protein Q4E93_20700 [Flavitalea sp. BT771]|uniref:hypothetical protein n=1 Tax=Flavitalea sp. BT771 TaxID=3063329 RepID=UPI0026E2B5DF|nr:hypothetical protein [Flavitalea sp. BT771]MDO6433040.1 hypothetical protein [Flavitalea sp. BT771]MDV6221684.1 hypothetical protein [Flavitalea sp. BT771]